MSLQYYDSDNEALIPVAGNVNPSDVIELKTTKADKTQISNPNLLDNPWFTVNQRRFTSESGINKYTVDRWYTILSANVTVNADKSITIAGTGDYGSCICQRLPSELKDGLLGRVVTFSVLLSDGTLYKSTDNFPSVLPETDTQYCGLDGIIPNSFASGVYWSNAQNMFVAQIGQTTSHNCTIKAVKLEIGSVSTLAMDTAPNYATELLKCQRYFVSLGYLVNSTYEAIGAGFIKNANRAYIYVKLPITMRTTPVITQEGKIYVQTPTLGPADAPSVFENVSARGNQAILLYLKPDTSDKYTTGVAAVAQFNQSSSGTSRSHIDFSADL